jgi:glyoxalase family protein
MNRRSRVTNDSTALGGIHHVTAIASDPQQNVDFYMGLLGLRLVKRTVNFDDPGSYHLYYGDDLGRPGTAMTFFAWPGAPRGRGGTGEVGVTAFSVPFESVHFWRERLAAAGVTVQSDEERWGDRVLALEDLDGMALEIVGARDGDPRPGWADGPVPAEHAVRGFHAPTLVVPALAPSERMLSEIMGFRRVAEDGPRVRFATGEGAPGQTVDLVVRPGDRPLQAAGSVHHIAFRTPDDATEAAWQSTLRAHGVGVTEVRDRQYFHSIYYREPGGVLYEIATDEPGFAIDESPDALGTALKLPPWLEQHRARIEDSLPPITLPTQEAAP